MLYAASAAAAVALLRSGSSSVRAASDEKQETVRVLDWPAGRWIVLAVALGFLADGLYNVYRGVTTKFRERLKTGEMSRGVERAAVGSGVAGHLARGGVVFALVGVFLAKAAIEYDPNEAVGIDGALLKLVQHDQGPPAARARGRRPDRLRPVLPGRGPLPQDLSTRPPAGRGMLRA